MTDTAARQKARALMAFGILEAINSRTKGAGAVEHVHIAALTAIAENRALWLFLIDKGLATEEQRQDYLDRGYKQLRDQVEQKASSIYIAEAGNG